MRTTRNKSSFPTSGGIFGCILLGSVDGYCTSSNSEVHLGAGIRILGNHPIGMMPWSKGLWRLCGICSMSPDERKKKFDRDYSPAALVKATRKKKHLIPLFFSVLHPLLL